MSRRVATLVAALALLIVLAAVVVATLQLIGTKRMLVAGLTTVTGREIQVEGSAKLRAGLAPGLLIESVTLGPAQGSALRSARIGRLDIVVALWPLIRGDIEVRRLEIADAEVALEPSAVLADAETPGAPGWRYSLQRAEVRDLKLEIQRDGAAAPMTASLERLSLGARGSAPHSIEFEGTLAGGHVTGSGSLDLSAESRSLSLRLHAEVPNLQALSALAQRDLPALGPARASGLVELSGETFGVSDLDLQLGGRDTAWLEVNGSVRDIAKLQGFELKADFGFDDVRVLSPLVRDPPHIGRVVGKASVHDVDGPARVEKFTLEGGRPGVFEVDVEGHFDDVKGVHGLDAHIDLKAHDLTVLGELFHRTLPPTGAVELSGSVTAQGGKLTTHDITARIGRTHLQGSISGEFETGARPRLTAKLDIQDLYLEDLGLRPEPDSDAGQAADAPKPRTADPGSRLFDDTPLDLAWSQAVEGQLAVRTARVLGVDGPLLHDFAFDGRLEDGQLSLKHVVADVDGGATRGTLRLDSRTSPPTFALEATATGLNLGELLEQVDADGAWSGKLDAKLELDSTGASPRAVVSRLGGEIVLSSRGGTISSEHARLLTRDVLHSFRRVVGLGKASKVLNCLIVDFEVHDGLASARTLAIDSEDIVVAGEGEIDLRRETLDLRLIPRPRRPSPLSTAATVQIKGPLTNPTVKIQKGSLVTSATAAIVKNIGSATGIRRLWRMFTSDASDASPCEKLETGTP